MGRKLSSPLFITGAGGFIGSHLTELCVELGYTVRAFVHYNANGRWGWLDESFVKNDIEVVAGDVRDFDSVLNAMKGCRTVLHLAALIGIPYSYVSPVSYVRTNVEGTYNILEAARTLGIERVAVTSTSETYGSAQYTPMDERHPSVGQSPYAATKIGADQLAFSYYCSFGAPVCVVRPFNTYGPRQSARAFIPSVASQLLSGQPRLRVGNLAPIRDVTYVKDTVSGFLSIASCDALLGSATNIGMNQEISMRDLVHKIAALAAVEVEIEVDEQRVRGQGTEVEHLRCDNTKLTSHTGWAPKYSLDSGLTETIDWIQGRLEQYKPQIYNI